MSLSEFQIANVDYIAIGDVTQDVLEESAEFIGRNRRRLVICDTHGGCFSIVLTGTEEGLILNSVSDSDVDSTVNNELIKNHRISKEEK